MDMRAALREARRVHCRHNYAWVAIPMTYPALFDQFQRTESLSDGICVYDFLGGAIDASFKYDWERYVVPEGQKVKPAYPSLSEWTVDWLACMLAAKLAAERFNVIELGAGYGQWMVTSILAFKALNPNAPAHGMAIEADPTHYAWLITHVERNLGRFRDTRTDLLQAAAGLDGSVEFPVIDEPLKDYGASYTTSFVYEKTVTVGSLSLETIDTRFGETEIDLLHIDIQGAEEDLIRHSGYARVLDKTRTVLFGTHEEELHADVLRSLHDAGFAIKVNWPGNSLISTPYGTLNTNDGAILAVNDRYSDAADAVYDFRELAGAPV